MLANYVWIISSVYCTHHNMRVELHRPSCVMGLSQASWLVSCASGTHRCAMVSTFPRHILTTHRLAQYCNLLSTYILIITMSCVTVCRTRLKLTDGVIA